ncbi:Hypothetical predicted protein [Cloeon dipterum]|uniref:Peptidase S1 domain-containing protein n=1 Tax=Cloeon dipterum TaxID=197152 RepID=A0A8S1CR22_9INSE|nr:Hypothetical predicted protein [Cloeon dipterum]
MDRVKFVVIVFLIFTTLLRQLKAFECQLPREDDTIIKNPQPVYYGTPSDVSVEGCGLQDPKTLTNSFPWDVVVYFREDVCVTPGVIISPRSILFGLESCKPENYQEITVFLAGIHANYAAAPQLNATTVKYENKTLTAIATFNIDIKSIKPSSKPVCIANEEPTASPLLFETFLLSEEDEIVNTKFTLQSKDYCEKKFKTPAQCATFNSSQFACVSYSGQAGVFASAEFVYSKMDHQFSSKEERRYFLGGKLHKIYPELYAPSTIIELMSGNSRNILLKEVPDLYALFPPLNSGSNDPLPDTSTLESVGCGRLQVPFVSLVAHGTIVPHHQLHFYPWHALVEANYYNDELEIINQYCGGTIISETVIVTAAHCLLSESSIAGSVTRYDPHEVRVHGGVYKRSNTKEVLKQEKDYRQSREVKQIITHPEYKLNANTDDIALIIVKRAFDTSSIHVKPACLWNLNASPDLIVDTYGAVVGWGLEETFKINDTLRVADIPVIDYKKCFSADREFYNNRLWYGYNFCAGVKNGTSVCNGDSGGGLILYDPKTRRFYLRGIVSTAKSQIVDGKAVCDYSTYALFTDVARYVPWIMEHVLKTF